MTNGAAAMMRGYKIALSGGLHGSWHWNARFFGALSRYLYLSADNLDRLAIHTAGGIAAQPKGCGRDFIYPKQ